MAAVPRVLHSASHLYALEVPRFRTLFAASSSSSDRSGGPISGTSMWFISPNPVTSQGSRIWTSLKSRVSTSAAAGEGPVDGLPSNGARLTYRDAGVDIDAGTELVRRIAKMTPGIGGFGGLYPFGDSFLVAGTDGVGTKLKIAFEMDKHDTIGIDLVAMSVNDIVTVGAKPLFFLDYFATGRLDVDKAEQVIRGIVDGCRQSDCALLGGETAEMPGFYADGEYDLSGFAVGAVKQADVVDGSATQVGDIILGLPSSGIHSNGFSLVRRVIAASGSTLSDMLPGGTDGISIGEALLAPTIIYVKQVLSLLERFNSSGGGGGEKLIRGIAHITGGGFTDNIPRVLPKGLAARINTKAWTPPPVFQWLQQAGGVEDAEMRRTFNLGIGLVLVVAPVVAETLLRPRGEAAADGQQALVEIGQVVEGDRVEYVE
eukprot:TRINITY_DN16597_c0_g1_i1.p1 TRINITY_DN16597_c0_g1~~TRINITY_DN16597_c0_g1_i1.p1  ORF type:complete len:446 (+),score=114.99 TRINITY_DN16597_c0_g1_i1:51-1340(+)